MKRRNRRPDDTFSALFGTSEASADEVREEACAESAEEAEEREEALKPAPEGEEDREENFEEAPAETPEETPEETFEETSEEAPEETTEETSEETPEPEEETREEDAEEPSGEEESPAGEETGEETLIEEGESEEKGKKRKRSGKVKEPMPRKKKVVIGVVAALLIVAVLAAVIVPVTIFFVNNQVVSSAEDLLALDWNALGGKKVYLQKDITVEGDLEIPAAATIDLNKHTLTVNGALKISAAGDVAIGTVTRDGFNEKGALKVTALQADMAEGTFAVYADTTIGEGSISAARAVLDGSVHLGGELLIAADKAEVPGAVDGGEGAAISFTGGDVLVRGNVLVPANLNGGAYAEIKGETADVTADGQSYVVLSGKAKSVVGGKGVLALKNFECGYFIGAEKLGVFVASCSGNEIFEDVGDIFYIEQLETPPAAQVDMRGDNVILTVTEVEHSEEADFSYTVTVSDTVNDPIVFDDVTGNEVDITSAVTGAGIYNIFIVAQGNFEKNEEGKYDFDSFTKDVYYIDSLPCGLKYEHTFTLDTPDNLSVTESEGGITVKFNAVPFADYYYVFVGDGEAMRADTNELFIENSLLIAGSNSIYVQALSDNEQIFASGKALTSYVKYEKLATPSVGTPVVNGKEVAVSWGKTDNSPARMFEVKFTYNTATGSAEKIVFTTAVDLTVTLDDLAEGSQVSVSVKAVGYGYYTDSDAGVAVAQ